MTEQDTALRFDQSLDGQPGIDLNGSDSLLTTAQTMQTLFDRQRAIPSDSFVQQLERTLMPPLVIPTATVIPSTIVIPSEAEGSPAAAASPPHEHSSPARPSEHRRSFSRLVAIAAAVVLIVGGAGAIYFGPMSTRNDEPSAIPAASFASPAASPSEATWFAPAPEGAGPELSTPMFVDGRIIRSFIGTTSEQWAQAIDAETRSVLWEKEIGVGGDFMAADGDYLLIAGQNRSALGSPSMLLALDLATGNQLWHASLRHAPVGMTVTDDRVLILGQKNGLEAFDLANGASLHRSDIGGASNPLNDVMRWPVFIGDGRLAVVGDTLAAVLADGSLAGVDIESGEAKWWKLRPRPGQVSVSAVDESIVALDSGDQEPITEDTMSFGTPIPDAPPVVSESIPRAPCLDAIGAATPVASTDAAQISAQSKTVMGLDPTTGDVRWTVVSSQMVPILIPNDSELVYWSVNTEDWPDALSLPTFCTIDPATGHVTEIERLEEIARQTFFMGLASEPGRVVHAGILDQDELLTVFDHTAAVPDVILDDASGQQIYGIQVYDGALYYTKENKDLVRVEIPEP